MESQFVSAQREVNEHMDTRSLDIQALRQKILVRPDILFARTDDEFLVRFLRARKYDKEKAFQVSCLGLSMLFWIFLKSDKYTLSALNCTRGKCFSIYLSKNNQIINSVRVAENEEPLGPPIQGIPKNSKEYLPKANFIIKVIFLFKLCLVSDYRESTTLSKNLS